MAIEEYENRIVQIISKPEISKNEWNLVCDALGQILSILFSKQDKETGLRRWSVDLSLIHI